MSEQVAGGLKGGFVRLERTRWRSQEGRFPDLREGVEEMWRNWAVVGWLKAENPSTGGRKAPLIGRWTLMEEWVRPEW